MSLFSAVPQDYKSDKKIEPKKMAPCGHTAEQAAWLGCTEKVCRGYDEMATKQYQAWVAAGRPGVK